MYFKNPYFSIENKLDLLSKWILVHSILYYELNNSIVSDTMFDSNCKQYKQMALEFPKIFKLTNDYRIFSQYIKCPQNSTYDLLTILPNIMKDELTQIALQLINKNKK